MTQVNSTYYSGNVQSLLPNPNPAPLSSQFTNWGNAALDTTTSDLIRNSPTISPSDGGGGITSNGQIPTASWWQGIIADVTNGVASAYASAQGAVSNEA